MKKEQIKNMYNTSMDFVNTFIFKTTKVVEIILFQVLYSTRRITEDIVEVLKVK